MVDDTFIGWWWFIAADFDWEPISYCPLRVHRCHKLLTSLAKMFQLGKRDPTLGNTEISRVFLCTSLTELCEHLKLLWQFWTSLGAFTFLLMFYCHKYYDWDMLWHWQLNVMITPLVCSQRALPKIFVTIFTNRAIQRRPQAPLAQAGIRYLLPVALRKLCLGIAVG